MPLVLEEVEVKLEFSDLLRRRPLYKIAAVDGFVDPTSQHREPGVHMSGILKPLAISAKQLKVGSEEYQETGEYPLLWAAGVAWEEFVASLYPEMDYQPGSVCRDGIWMTCDGVSLIQIGGVTDENGEDAELPVIEEMKYTHVSSNKPMLEQWMKLQQGKAYCYGYGARLVRWHQFHVRGDYKKFGPVYKRSLVEFTEEEVLKCWKMFVANKSLAKPE